MIKKLAELFKSLLSLRERDFVLTVNHQEVISHLTHDARLTIRYIFMTIISVSIATMGIILNDITTVVGAMLIAPMMNPIVLLGFSICRVNYTEFTHSIRSILIGIFLAILVSFLIVKISPMHEITDEILSRTEPNIYNLLVALFSGAAGAYTKIKRKGEEIIGVAIASSLIPPLSVVGFSLAIAHYQLAREALFLFVTNLVAIALAGTILARWYGFGFRVSKTSFLWQISVYSIAIITLSVPLVMTLREVVYEIATKHTISDTIEDIFDKNAELNSVQAHFPDSKKDPIHIKAIVFTDQFKREAESNIKLQLESNLQRPVSIKLEQVIYSETDKINEDMSFKLPQRKIISMVQNETPFPVRLVNVNAKSRLIEVFITASPHQDYSSMYMTEIDLNNKFRGWTVRIVPPATNIPVIHFANNKTILSGKEKHKFEVILWMLERWNTYEVTVTGYSNDTSRGHTHSEKLTLKRISYISNKLNKNGIKSISNIEYRETLTTLNSGEEDYGIKNENKVTIELHNTSSIEDRIN